MKKAILVCFIFIFLGNIDVSAGINLDILSVKNIEQFLPLHVKTLLQNSTDSGIYDVITLKENTFIYATRIILTIILCIFTFFMIIVTPLILFYCWANNYFDYRKYHSLIYSLKSKSEKVPKRVISAYKPIFSNMYANAFGFLTWMLSSYYYVSISYNQESVGLLDYLRFPFKLLSGITNGAESINDAIPLGVWVSVLLIIAGISTMLFLLGRFIGNTIVNFNYNNKSLFQIMKPQVEI